MEVNPFVDLPTAEPTSRTFLLLLLFFSKFYPNVCALPKVRDNIRRALQKLILSPDLSESLVQFWAPITPSEGQTVLVSQYQPFAFGTTASMSARQKLSEYKMEMSRKYNFFYADAKSREEQRGLPGRVFLHQFHESILKVEYYSTKDYPQRDLALRCQIRGSWAVPVFEHSSETCVGVLEIASLHNNNSSYWGNEAFLVHTSDIFQEFGLQCSDRYKICEMQCREKIKREGLTPAFQELHWALRSVCEIHKLPLGMIWVPCGACNGLLQGPVWTKDGFATGIEKYAHTHSPLNDFLRVRKIRKGWVARTALSSPYMLYFPDLTKLSVDEYPLVPYARMCKFSGWFIICLQNSNTGDDKYVLEFFWSTGNEDSEDIVVIQPRLNGILGTMAEKLGNFRFSSGANVGHLSYVEVFNAQNDPKKGSFYQIQATRTFSRDSDPSSVSSSASVSNLRPW